MTCESTEKLVVVGLVSRSSSRATGYGYDQDLFTKHVIDVKRALALGIEKQTPVFCNTKNTKGVKVIQHSCHLLISGDRQEVARLRHALLQCYAVGSVPLTGKR